ncbi:uncharacterized protein DC041_0011387 [Schistosoma bovis]|uniref:Uncharacterized protein n=1 Tax=Schistosoma bovis TaxID=6184 RepID=A0A430QDQ7_SCHBO|nr:uncharacterized protein DC041_0011387 [Schistosoma bovis]
MNSCSVSTGTIRKKPKKVISTEAFQASVAEREALAAAANLTLLPDEPPNRLVNVVGQALRHGKTVVYEVMRTAARQPDGELIPVGGLGTTASSTNLTTVQTNSQIDGALKNHQEGIGSLSVYRLNESKTIEWLSNRVSAVYKASYNCKNPVLVSQLRLIATSSSSDQYDGKSEDSRVPEFTSSKSFSKFLLFYPQIISLLHI